MRRWATSVILFTSVFAVAANCASINIGLLSYDLLIPGPSGVNAFTLNNFTGDPVAGGFALPPDFPVYDFLNFQGGTLTLTSGGPLTVLLGNIAPGTFDSLGSLEFPDTTVFTSALFTATLSQANLLLSDGSTFVADSPDITLTLLPSSGPSLVAGADLAVLSVTGYIVPEPASFLLLGTGLLTLITVSRIRRRI